MTLCKSRTLVTAILSLVTSLSLSFQVGCARKAEATLDQARVSVRLRTPHRVHQPVSVCASGSTEANITALSAFQVGGRVARVYVGEGQFVRKGQVLAELDSTDYRNALDAAAGQLATAKAAALQAANGPRSQELEEARIEFVRAQDEYQRMKYMYDRQSLPANDFHKFEAAYLAAQQRYDMARQGTRIEQKLETAAEADAASAQMREARKHLNDSRLLAPISGFIGMKRVDVGDTVAPGYPVFSVLDLDPVKVRVGVPEDQIGIVKEGARAVVTVPSLDNQQFEGTVHTVGVSADLASRTFTTEILVPNAAHVLRAGMVTESRVYGSRAVDALTVPVLAIVQDPCGVSLVYVYDSTRGRVLGRRVDPGSLVDGEVEIRSGLRDTDQIVVAGQQNVHEGSPVQVVGGVQ